MFSSVSRARRTCRKGEEILVAMVAGIIRVVVELEQFTFVIHTIAPEKYRF